VFDSPTKARLQEIGPRFTLKLRWLKKGLPSVTAPDGRIAHGGDQEPAEDTEELRKQEQAEEDDAMGELGKAPLQPQGPIIPPLDQEQEYEWKWKVCLLSSLFGLWVALTFIAKDGGFETYFLPVVFFGIVFCNYVSYPAHLCICVMDPTSSSMWVVEAVA
jgi:hypothetical protein